MKKLIIKYKEILLYLFFGGCTTLVNIIAYVLGTRLFGLKVMESTVLAWFLAVLFAYLTNRRYVFKSSSTSIKAVFIEAAAFYGCRLLTGFIDFGMMYIFVGLLFWNDLLIKIISNLIVIISNYAASRLFIFKKHD
jgi:putative flippase GtrA